jgi:ABC-2 type transport system permease protein
MGEVWAMAMKDVRLLIRDRIGFFFAFFFPVIVAVFFGVIFAGPGGDGKPRPIAVVVVDEDGTEASRAFVGTLQRASELEVVGVLSRAEGEQRVRSGRGAAAMVVVPRGFATSSERLFFDESGEGGITLELGVDPSRRAEGGMLEGVLTKYAFERVQTVFTDPKAGREQARRALEFFDQARGVRPTERVMFTTFFRALDSFLAQREAESAATTGSGTGSDGSDSQGASGGAATARFEPVRVKKLDLTAERESRAMPPSSFAVTFPQGVLWGVMGCALSFSISLVLERTGGTLLRLRAAPIRRWQILGGKALACFLVTLAVSVLLMAVGTLAFGVRPRSWPMLGAGLVATAVAFIGIMMLLAVAGKSERGGNGLGWGVLLVLSMIGGGMLPLIFMPAWMHTLSLVSPVRWAILVIEMGVWRPADWSDFAGPCAVLIGVGVGGFLLGARMFRSGE